ncbi:MAG TPA: protein kinase [Chloroflexota bacterium]|nr:protein kinase [Chloroflexota bacterium]
MEPRGQLVKDRYALEALLGEGGDALVYRATDRHLRRTVAVKLLRPELRADPTFVARFEREARSAGRLAHPHIVPVYDYGEALGTYFLVMEYVAGGDLRARLRQGAPLAADRTARLSAEIAAALGAAHALDIVHRDVKPANVLLTEDDHAKVTDFGIAKMLAVPQLTATAAILGTPHYLAPEQATGGGVTPASDVYSLGVVLYEMLAGRRPFEGESFVHVAMQHLNAVPPPLADVNPAVPPALAAIVARALAKDPAERFPDGAALSAALRALDEPRGAPSVTTSGLAARRTSEAGGRRPTPAPRPAPAAAPGAAWPAAAPGAAPPAAPPQPRRRATPRTDGAAVAAHRALPAALALPARLRRAASAAGARLPGRLARRPAPTPSPPAADRPVAIADPPAGARRVRPHGHRDPYATTATVAVAAALALIGVVGARAIVGTWRAQPAAVAEAPAPPTVPTEALASPPPPAPLPPAAPEPTIVAAVPAVALEPVAAPPAEPTALPTPPPTAAPEPEPAPPSSAPPRAPAAPRPAVAALSGATSTGPAPEPPPGAPPARAVEVSAPEPAPEPAAPVVALAAPEPEPAPAVAPEPPAPAAPAAGPAGAGPAPAQPHASQPPAAPPRAAQVPVPPAPVVLPPYPVPWGPPPMGPVPPMMAPPGMVPPYLRPPGPLPPIVVPIATPQPPPGQRWR